MECFICKNLGNLNDTSNPTVNFCNNCHPIVMEQLTNEIENIDNFQLLQRVVYLFSGEKPNGYISEFGAMKLKVFEKELLCRLQKIDFIEKEIEDIEEDVFNEDKFDIDIVNKILLEE